MTAESTDQDKVMLAELLGETIAVLPDPAVAVHQEAPPSPQEAGAASAGHGAVTTAEADSGAERGVVEGAAAVIKTAIERGYVAVVVLATLSMLMPPAAAQPNSGETQNGVVVLRGSGPPEAPKPQASPAEGGAPSAEPPKLAAGYCDTLAQSNRPQDRKLYDTICGSRGQKGR